VFIYYYISIALDCLVLEPFFLLSGFHEIQ